VKTTQKLHPLLVAAKDGDIVEVKRFHAQGTVLNNPAGLSMSSRSANHPERAPDAALLLACEGAHWTLANWLLDTAKEENWKWKIDGTEDTGEFILAGATLNAAAQAGNYEVSKRLLKETILTPQMGYSQNGTNIEHTWHGYLLHALWRRQKIDLPLIQLFVDYIERECSNGTRPWIQCEWITLWKHPWASNEERSLLEAILDNPSDQVWELFLPRFQANIDGFTQECRLRAPSPDNTETPDPVTRRAHRLSDLISHIASLPEITLCGRTIDQHAINPAFADGENHHIIEHGYLYYGLYPSFNPTITLPIVRNTLHPSILRIPYMRPRLAKLSKDALTSPNRGKLRLQK